MATPLSALRPVAHRRIVMIVSLGIQAAGFLILWLWHLGHWPWLALGKDYYPIAPLTALLFITLAMAWLATLGKSALARQGSRVLAGFTAVVALAQTTADLVGQRVAWNVWLALPDSHFGDIPVGLTATTTMIGMVLSAMAVLALTLDRRKRWLVVVGSLASGSIASVMALSYVFGRGLPQATPYVPMALITAALFITLNVAMLASAWSLRQSLNSPKTAPLRRGLWIAATVIGPFIILLGIYFIHLERTTALRTASNNLSTIAKLKARQVSDWRQERIAEALFLQSTPSVARSIEALIAHPHQEMQIAEVNQWLNPIRGGQRYAAAAVFDSADNLLHAVGNPLLTSSRAASDALSRRRHASLASLSEIKIAPDGVATLDVVVPISISPSAVSPPPPPPIVVLTVKLQDLFYPAVREWPLPTTSGEIYLVTRQADRVSYASPLRRGHTPALLDEAKNAADFAGLSPRATEPQVHVTHDYTGLPVLTALLPVPGSDWVLVVQMDQSEIFAPLGTRVVQVGLLAFVLLLAVTLALGYLWQSSETMHAGQVLQAERERHALAAKLGLVLDHANEGILLFDHDQRIVESNTAASRLYGHASAELHGMTAIDLRSPADRASAPPMFTTALQPEGTVFEAEHVNRNGRVFPVEVSARPVMIEGEPHVLAIIRDITERKSRERDIERYGRIYQVLSNINQAIVRSGNKDTLCQDICDILVDIGSFQLAWIGWHNPDTNDIETAFTAGDTHGFLQSLRISTKPTTAEGSGPIAIAFRGNTPYVCNEFLNDPNTLPLRQRAADAGVRSAIALPLHLNGRPNGVLAVYAGEVDFFGPREIELLVKAAEDLDFAMEIIQRDQQRQQADRALASSEMRLKTLLNSSPAVIYAFTVGKNAGTTYLSPNVHLVLGYSPSEFLRNPQFWQKGVHPDDFEQASTSISKGVAPNDRTTRIYRFRHADGSYRWLHDEVRPICAEDGAVLEYVGFFIDITERRTAEAQLRKLTRAINQAPVSIAVTDLDGAIEYVNPHFAKTSGYVFEELDGQNSRLLQSGKTPKSVYQNMWDTLLRGETWKGELRNRRKNGEIYDELAVISPVVDEHGRTSHYVAVKEDITERKRADVALWQSLDRLARAERIARLGNWELNHQTGDMLCSEEFFRIYEIPEHVMTKDDDAMQERIHPDDRKRVEIEFREAFASKHRFRIRHRIRLPDGRIKHVETSGESRHEEGTPTTFTIGTLQDITEQVQTEMELNDVVHALRVHLRVSQIVSGGLPLKAEILTEIASLLTSSTTEPARTRVTISVRDHRVDAGPAGPTVDELVEPITVSGRIIGEITMAYTGPPPVPAFKPTEQDFTASVARTISLAIAENEALTSLRTSEERFRAIFDHAQVGMFETSKDGIITRANPRLGALFQDAPNLILGRRWSDFCIGEFSQAPPTTGPVEIRFKRGKTETFVGLLKSRAETDSQQVVQGYICIVHDVTDLVAARATMQRFNAELEVQVAERTAELNASNREVQAILSAVPDTLLRMREDGTIVFQHRTTVTPGLAHLLDHAGSLPPFPANHDLAGRIMAAGKQAMNASTTVVVETEVATDEGLRSLELRTAPVAAHEFVVLVRDITDRKRAEQETLSSLEKERQLSEMKSRFISVTSHEFRTPMAAALGSLDLLSNHYDRLDKAKREQLFDRIKISFQRMTEMLDDVLTLNRIDSGRTPVSLGPIDLCRLIRELIDENQLADSNQHVFAFHPEQVEMKFVTDSGLLHHILSNLLSNAVRYSPPATHIEVHCATTPEGVLIQVHDHGIGVPKEDLERIFSPFERGSNVGTIKGTGLGLNIVKNMTTLLGGEISVSCPPSGGSCFEVHLPHPIES